MFSFPFRLQIVACFIAIVSAAQSKADLIVQTENFDGFPNFSAVLTFDQFDTSQGTLNSVAVEFYVESQNGELRLDNDSPDVATGTVSFGSSGLISSVDVSLLNNAFQPVVNQLMGLTQDNINLQGDDGDVEAGGTINFSQVGPDYGVLVPNDNSQIDSGFIANSLINQFEGIGTYDITAQLGQVIDFGGIGGLQFQGDPIFVNGYVRITYDFTVIPEPASFVCLMGIGGIALVRRRRRNAH